MLNSFKELRKSLQKKDEAVTEINAFMESGDLLDAFFESAGLEEYTTEEVVENPDTLITEAGDADEIKKLIDKIPESSVDELSDEDLVQLLNEKEGGK